MLVPLVRVQWRRAPGRLWLSAVFFLVASLALPGSAGADHLGVAWDPPVTNADGTPLQDLAGYRVYYGTASTGAVSAPCNASYVDVPNVTSYQLTGLKPGGLYYVRTTARDSAGQESGCSMEAGGYAQPDTPGAVAGPVAAYAFSEGAGTTVADASGSGNSGTITGATWTTAGKAGSALTFNGNAWVTVKDAASLDLTTAFTLMAWVYPTATPTDWTTVVLKEQTGELTYALYASNNGNRPEGCIYLGYTQCATASSALPLNTWSHLAVTYDNAALRLYVNGSQAASRALTGSAPISTGPLKIGGNAVWGEYFRGRLDEVRVYNWALAPTDIQADMQTAVTGATSQVGLSVMLAGVGAGTVVSAPAGITCGSDCSESYPVNTAVTLTATPGAGSTFTGWSGGCTGTGPCTLTLTQPQTVGATFALQAAQTADLTVTTAGSGAGTITSTPAGITCGSDCSEPYPVDTAVTLTATPAAGSTFAGWSGACTGTTTCTVTMSQSQTVTATFNAATRASKRRGSKR